MVKEVLDGGDWRKNDLISNILKGKRRNIPSAFQDHISLSQMLFQEVGHDSQGYIAPELFLEIIGNATEYFSEISPDYRHLSYERYLVKIPENDQRGGFHGDKKQNNLNPGGYLYFSDIAHGTVLNKNHVKNITLRTYELARSYLHDSIHANTFRSFRLDSELNIYRFQYGINYRDSNGCSFSFPKPSIKEGKINLNVLMEGVIEKTISRFLLQQASEQNAFNLTNLTSLERKIWADI